MATSMLTRPLDQQAKRERREEVKRLAETVRAHTALGSWAEPTADLALSELEYHVGGIMRYIAGVFVEIFGELDASTVLETMLNGSLHEEHVEVVFRILEECKRNLLAAELLELYRLAVSARGELDSVITGPHGQGGDDGVRRAVAEVIAADHAGELRQAKRLSQALLDGAGENEGLTRAVLERAFRDQKRLVELGVIEPPLRNWRQRVLEALRYTPAEQSYYPAG